MLALMISKVIKINESKSCDEFEKKMLNDGFNKKQLLLTNCTQLGQLPSRASNI